jgi:dTDP-4-dehydrorhamnose reductase
MAGIAMTTRNHMLFFGFGYSAKTLAARLDPSAWKISATSRSTEGAAAIAALGHEGLVFAEMKLIAPTVTHIISSVPPDESGDPVLARFGTALAKQAGQFKWLAYLSTTGVYGDHGGGWVDENTALTPNTERGQRRLAAENAWLQLYQTQGLPLHIFRLAGIYGPDRNVIENLKAGTAKRVIRKGQVFSRIHVEDIAGVLQASMARPQPGRAYNVADNMPCPPQDVVSYGASLLGMDPPPEIAFEDAKLSPMARSFFADSKRVSNARITSELGYRLLYPSYREGLAALL